MRIMSQCLLIAFMMLFPVSLTVQGKNAPPIPADELVGIWVGFDKYGSSFTRLDLRAGLSGYVSQVGVARPLGVYRISNAQYDGHHFTMDLMPISKDAEAGVHVSARPGLALMDLLLRSKGWKREVRIFPEKDLDESNRQAKAAIETATKLVSQNPDHTSKRHKIDSASGSASPRKLTATPFRHPTIVQKRTGALTHGQFFVAVR